MADKFFDSMFTASVLGGSSGPAPVIVTKNITANGTYSAVDDQANGYDPVIVDVPNTYTAGDEGKVVDNGQLVAQTSTTATANGTIDTTTNNQVIVNVPNSYTAGDEGKVVSNGALVAQTAYPTTITENDTYDTTNYNSITVNVSGGTSSSVSAQLYTDSAFTTTAKGYITVYNQSTIIVSGVLKYGSTAVPYYINPTELQLSDYLSSDKSMTLQKTSSTSSIETATGTLSVSNNLISIQLTSGSGTATTALFGTKSIT